MENILAFVDKADEALSGLTRGSAEWKAAVRALTEPSKGAFFFDYGKLSFTTNNLTLEFTSNGLVGRFSYSRDVARQDPQEPS